MTAKEYIANNDLLGAYERFENTSIRWYHHWWETVVIIYKGDTKWKIQYSLDLIEQKLTKDDKYRVTNYASIQVECKNEITNCGAYFVTHYLNGKVVWSKCGMTTRGLSRIDEQQRKDYRWLVDNTIVRLWFPCEFVEQAKTMEDVMRRYFRDIKRYNYLATDRFPEEDVVTKEDIDFLSRKYKEVLKLYET